MASTCGGRSGRRAFDGGGKDGDEMTIGADAAAVAAVAWHPCGIGKEGESTIIENVCAGGGAGDFAGLGDLMNGDCTRSGTTAPTGGGVAVLGDERPACDTGVVEGDGRSKLEAVGGQSDGDDDAAAGRPAAASDALNFDVLPRILGAMGACCGSLEDDDDAPAASETWVGCKGLAPGVGRTAWMYLPSGPRLYTSPLRRRSSTSWRPWSSASLALSSSPPTSFPASSSFPVRIARWMVRVEEAGSTDPANDVVAVSAAGIDAP